MYLIQFSRTFTIFAMDQLAKVDYNVATRVSEDVAKTVKWAYLHNQPLIADFAINILQRMDDFGSILIAFVVWIVHNTN